jgi:hypothetical protein
LYGVTGTEQLHTLVARNQSALPDPLEKRTLVPPRHVQHLIKEPSRTLRRRSSVEDLRPNKRLDLGTWAACCPRSTDPINLHEWQWGVLAEVLGPYALARLISPTRVILIDPTNLRKLNALRIHHISRGGEQHPQIWELLLPSKRDNGLLQQLHAGPSVVLVGGRGLGGGAIGR